MGDKSLALSDAKGFLTRTITIENKDIKYVVFVPSNYDSNKPHPTILFLNGHGECGTDGFRQVTAGLGPAVMADIDAWPFLIVFPQKQEYDENWEDEESILMAIVDQVRKDFNVDPSRFYLTGISQGGHGTMTIASMHSDLFAAIAPVCGWGDEEIAKKLTTLPILMFHGDADEAVPVQSSIKMDEWINANGGSCKLTIYPGVPHNSWDRVYREEKLGAWFLQHTK